MPALAPLNTFRSVTLRILDLALIIGGILILRRFIEPKIDIHVIRPAVWSLIPVILVLFHIMRVYEVLHLRGLGTWCSRVMAAWTMVLGLFIGGLFFMEQTDEFPTEVVAVWAVSTAAGLVLLRCGLYWWMLSRHARGVSINRVLVAGQHAFARRVARHLSGRSSLGFQVVGLATDNARSDTTGDRFPVLGATRDLPTLIEAHQVDRVVVTGPINDAETPGRIFRLLARHPVTLQYAPDLSRFNFIGFNAADYDGVPVFNLSASPLAPTDLAFKWLEDKLLGLFIVMLISPALLLIAIAVKVSSPGPVFFIQERHGLYGRPIRVLKFRTMRVPSNATEAANASRGLERTPSGRFKQASGTDCRITPLGKFLRRTSLDELPQFLNVLKGDMSIVGPRPHPIGLNMQYVDVIDDLMQRHYVKPGITGLAQISGARGETRTAEDMRRRIRYDLIYIRTWSIWLDLKIIGRTIFKGFFNFQP